MEVVSTILKVAQQIAKKAETARRNRTRCRDLADRARNIGDILRDSSSSTPKAAAVAGGGDTASRRKALGRLRDALADALGLVESCRRQSGCFSWVTSGRTAARFQDVEVRISNCVGDLGLANDARIEKLLLAFANTRAGSWKETNRSHAKKKDGAKNGGSKSDDMNRNKAGKKDVAKNGNNGGTSSGAAAAAGNAGKKKGGEQQGGKGGCKQTRGKAAAQS